MPSDTRERIVAVARDLVHGASLSAATRVLAHLQGLALPAKAHDDPDLVLSLKDDLPVLLNPAR